MTSVEIVSGLSAFEALAEEWNALADRATPSPLLRHEWFMASARAFLDEGDLAVFVARRDGRIRAAAPMMVDRSGVVARLRLLGSDASEPEAFLYDDHDALEAVCKALLAAGRPVLLQRLATDSAEWRLLAGSAPRKGLAVLRPSTSPYYSTVLQPEWEDFERSMASKKRSELRKLRRELEQHGPVTFEMRKPSTTEAALEGLAELQRIEASGWKGRHRTDMMSRPPLARFMADYAALMARSGMLRLSTLRLAGEPIVIQMDVECGGRLWGLKMGTDERWLKYGPGILSTHELIRWSVENGLAGCEHLGRA